MDGEGAAEARREEGRDLREADAEKEMMKMLMTMLALETAAAQYRMRLTCGLL